MRYVTKRQRAILESIGIPHEKGRTRELAGALIEQAILEGRLPANCLDEPATENQLQFLESLGAKHASNITKKDASQLIERTLEAKRSTQQIRDQQIGFIDELHGIPDFSMNTLDASRYIEYLLDYKPLHCKKCKRFCEARYSGGRCGCGAYLPEIDRIKYPYQRTAPIKDEPVPPPIQGQRLEVPDYLSAVNRHRF